MQEQYTHRPLSGAHIDPELKNISWEFDSCDSWFSDLELLSSAVMATQSAVDRGVLLGSLDEVALRRAERIARLNDARRARKAVVFFGGAA